LREQRAIKACKPHIEHHAMQGLAMTHASAAMEAIKLIA
jgi:hypothetical protein